MKILPLLLPLVATAAEPPAAAPIPIRAFVGEEWLAQPQLSPDGTRLVLATRGLLKQREVRALAVVGVDGRTETLMPFPPGQVPLAFAWASERRIVASRGFRSGSRGPIVSQGEVLAVDRDGGNAKYLFGMAKGRQQGYGYLAGPPARWDGRVALAEAMWTHDATYLLDMDAVTGSSKLLTQVPQAHARFLLQKDGQPRFAYGYGENGRFQLWRRGEEQNGWRRVPDASVGALLKPVALSADDSELLALHSADGGPEVLVAENLATGARRVVAADPDGAIGAPMRATRRGEPFAAVSTVGIPRVHYLKPDNDRDVQLHRQLARHFKDGVVDFADATEDGGKVLVAVRSDRDPGSYYLYDRATGKAQFLFARMGDIDPERMAPRRPISFTGRDGTPLHGFLTMPAHPAGTKVPLVLLPHDGVQGVSDSWFFDADAQFLASRGYATLQVNFRGSEGRGPAFERAGFGEWRGKIVDDLVDGVRWAVANADVDGARMCTFGTGFGAFSALTLAAREPAMVKCAIGYAGIYDLRVYANQNWLTDLGSPENVARFVTDKRTDLKDLSPVSHAATLRAPVLLIHGGADTVAPDHHALRMREALRAAGRDPEWFFVDDEGHGFHQLENQAEVYRRVEAFLAKHLGK